MPRNKSFYVRGLKQLQLLKEQYGDIDFANAVLIHKPNGYYIHITTYIDKEVYLLLLQSKNVGDKLGIDFGIKHPLVFSNGMKLKFDIDNHKIIKRIKRLQTKINKFKKKGSKNRKKTIHLLNREYQKLNNIKRDIRNRIIGFTKLYNNLYFQDESIKQWYSGWFGKQIQSSAIGSIIGSLKQRHPNPVVLDRYIPTTKTCSVCGNIQNMSLNNRTYVCSNCGSISDRDINSAINMVKLSDFSVPWEPGELTPTEKKARVLEFSPYIRVSYASLK